MSCRTPVCQECSTTWEGIHYCARCLANERRRSVSRRSPVVVMVVVVLAAGLFWATTRLTVMTVVLMERLW